MNEEKFEFGNVEDYEKEIESTDKAKEDAEKEEEKNSKLWSKSTLEIEKQLAEIEKPFREKQEKLRETEQELSDKGYKLSSEKARFINYQDVKEALKVGEFDEKSLSPYLQHNNLTIDGWREPTLKKVLKNGIKVFRTNDSDGNYGNRRYFFFKGTKLVAFWTKRNSEHRGDDTQSQAWVGVKVMTRDNDVETNEWKGKEPKWNEGKEKHPFYRQTSHHYGRTDVTYNQFIEYVENFKNYKEINLNNEENIKKIKER